MSQSAGAGGSFFSGCIATGGFHKSGNLSRRLNPSEAERRLQSIPEKLLLYHFMHAQSGCWHLLLNKPARIRPWKDSLLNSLCSTRKEEWNWISNILLGKSMPHLWLHTRKKSVWRSSQPNRERQTFTKGKPQVTRMQTNSYPPGMPSPFHCLCTKELLS